MKTEEIYDQWKSLFPLSEVQATLLRKKFTTEYNFNSNHIEGNTLTYGQTELLLLFGKVRARRCSARLTSSGVPTRTHGGTTASASISAARMAPGYSRFFATSP